MYVWQLLESLDEPPVLREMAGALAPLRGAEIGPVRFLQTVEQSVSLRPAWAPVWFVPLGDTSPDRVFGLDLSPDLLADNRVSVAEIHGDRLLIGVADNIANYLLWHLARVERRERLDKPGYARSAELEAAHCRVERVFEHPLLSPQSLDGVDDVLSWLWSKGFRSPYLVCLLSTSDREANLSRIQMAQEVNRGCMTLALQGLAQSLALRNMNEATIQVSKAVDCMRYTMYNVPLAPSIPIARALARQYPGQIDATSLARFETIDDAFLRAKLATRPPGDEAARYLTDLGFLCSAPPTRATGLREGYANAGWAVAARLCASEK